MKKHKRHIIKTYEHVKALYSWIFAMRHSNSFSDEDEILSSSFSEDSGSDDVIDHGSHQHESNSFKSDSVRDMESLCDSEFEEQYNNAVSRMNNYKDIEIFKDRKLQN